MTSNLPWSDENKIKLPLDDKFIPAILWNRYFRKKVGGSRNSTPLSIAIIKNNDSIMVYDTKIFSGASEFYQINYYYVERLVKTLLWIYGGYKILINGPKDISRYIEKQYSTEGNRSFDSSFMSEVYEKSFTVEHINDRNMIEAKEESEKVGGFLEGCRIGFDLGASDKKVSAIIDGKPVFSEEVIWNPCIQSNPFYHYNEIMSMLNRAASHMPRVDAIGGSSAGIYINNRVMSASIFRSIPQDIFEKKVKDIFIDIQKKWKVPLKVINDGKVTALVGSMALKKGSILGIAMGSSEAGGYIDSNGKIGPGIDELAFIPVDFNPCAHIDKWSGDKGCGVQYFSQVATIRLAEKVGIELKKDKLPVEKLKTIQKLMKKGDERTVKVFKTVGSYLGYAISHYSDFYDIDTVLILGRVTSGEGGKIIFEEAEKVLSKNFSELAAKISIFLPDEKTRRVGQSIAAASLPKID